MNFEALEELNIKIQSIIWLSFTKIYLKKKKNTKKI